MNVYINQLVKSIFQKDSLEQCSVQELEQYVDRHPYFGAAQLLLAKKLQTEDAARYPEQLEKTFLFFHNPLWVQHLLNDNGNAEVIKGKQTEIKQEPVTEEISQDIEVSSFNNDIETENKVTEIIPEAQEEEINDEVEEDIEEIQTEEPEIKLPELKIEPVDASKAELLFQPYHTVDYFASQGIKMSEEAVPSDKFGKQLKSFTDWLKSMKKLPVSEMENQPETGSSQKVDQMAEASIMEGDIVTESMAQVWEKQGNPLKAIEIYNKLSLLDPPKSTYFAAKIEELKKTT
ncbi:MAG TPA: hypothetical protein PKC72_11315 [Chitinophagaceae bacterium]|nr:hypothetical protein [Chitinophagaceae bacterium]